MATARSIQTALEQIENALAGNLPKPVQEELANLVMLLHDLEKDNLENLVPAARIAISALILPDPEIEMAKRIITEIQRRRRAPVFKSPAVLIAMGLGLVLYIGIPLAYFAIPDLTATQTVLGLETGYLLLVAISGALGSIVSIMVRIQEFGPLTNIDKPVLIMTGFFKPVIGTTFALFIYAMIGAGLIPVTIQPGKEVFLFMALAFVAGFSERWVRDIATKTEEGLSVKTVTK